MKEIQHKKPCVKCSCKIFKYLQDEFISCTNCGTLVDVSVPETFAYDPRQKEQTVKEKVAEKAKNVTHEVCEKFKDSIKKLRAEGSDWPVITKLINKATGVRYGAKWIAKYAIIVIGYDPMTHKSPKVLR